MFNVGFTVSIVEHLYSSILVELFNPVPHFPDSSHSAPKQSSTDPLKSVFQAIDRSYFFSFSIHVRFFFLFLFSLWPVWTIFHQ